MSKNTVDILIDTQVRLGQLQALVQQWLPRLITLGTAYKAIGLVKDQIDYADAMGKSAQKAGVLVEKFSALTHAADLSDIGTEALVLAFKGLSDWMEKTGRAAEDNVEVLLETADLFERMPDGVQKTNLAIEMFGRSGLNMIPMLNQGRAAIEQLMEKAEKLGLVFTPAQAAAAEEFNDQLTILRKSGEGVLNDVLKPMLPLLVDMAKAANKLAEAWRDTMATTPGKSAALGILRGAVPGFLPAEVMLRQFMGGAEPAPEGRENKPAIDPIEAGKQRLQEILKDLELQGGRSQLRMLEMMLRPASQFDGFNRRDLLLTEIALQKDLLGKRAELISTAEMELGLINEIEAAEMALGVEREKQALAEQRRAFEWLGFKDVMLDGLDQLQFEWADLSGNSAAVALDSIQLGVQGVGDAIMGAITGTRTWGQVFSQVGQQIIANLINLVVQWIAQMTIVAALKRILGIQDTTMAAQMAATWAPAAIAASIASYGAASAVGTAAYAAALATGTGLTAGLSYGGAREYGGAVEAGKMYLTGERGREFFVPNQRGSIIPAGLTERMLAGNLAPNFSPNVKVDGGKVSVAFFDERQSLLNWVRSTEGRTEIINLIRGSKLDIGLTT